MKPDLTYELIKAACGGDMVAKNIVIEYYSDYIDELSNGDEDIRHALIIKLLETISQFDPDNPENNEKLLKEFEEN